MPAYTQPTFADRLTHAADAKAALLDRYRARPSADDPAVIAKNAERLKIHEDRVARQAERQNAKQEEHAREVEALKAKEEQELEAAVARQQQAEAEAEAAQQARRDRLAAKHLDAVDQKAARDARYASRKSRQKR